MNHFHKELLSGSGGSSRMNWTIESLTEPIDGAPVRGGTLQRGLDRYWKIPNLVKNKQGVDIYHGLAHDAGTLFRFLPKDSIRVATVHDLIPAGKFGGLSNRQKTRFRRQMQLLEDFDALFCVSKYTAEKLQEFISIDEEKVIVVPNGVDFDRFNTEVDCSKEQQRPYVLSVSSNHGRKNLELLPKAFEALDRVNPGMRLVRVGGSFSEDLREEWNRRVGADRLEEVSYCSDSDLVRLYQGASAFIFPSHEEGFGLPVLEAMAAGCPVACSDSSSLPEVGGGLPFQFSSTDAQSAGLALVEAISRKDDRAYIERGFERASKFSWVRCFEQMLDEYGILLDRKKSKS